MENNFTQRIQALKKDLDLAENKASEEKKYDDTNEKLTLLKQLEAFHKALIDSAHPSDPSNPPGIDIDEKTASITIGDADLGNKETITLPRTHTWELNDDISLIETQYELFNSADKTGLKPPSGNKRKLPTKRMILPWLTYMRQRWLMDECVRIAKLLKDNELIQAADKLKKHLRLFLSIHSKKRVKNYVKDHSLFAKILEQHTQDDYEILLASSQSMLIRGKCHGAVMYRDALIIREKLLGGDKIGINHKLVITKKIIDLHAHQNTEADIMLRTDLTERLQTKQGDEGDEEKVAQHIIQTLIDNHQTNDDLFYLSLIFGVSGHALGIRCQKSSDSDSASFTLFDANAGEIKFKNKEVFKKFLTNLFKEVYCFDKYTHYKVRKISPKPRFLANTRQQTFDNKPKKQAALSDQFKDGYCETERSGPATNLFWTLQTLTETENTPFFLTLKPDTTHTSKAYTIGLRYKKLPDDDGKCTLEIINQTGWISTHQFINEKALKDFLPQWCQDIGKYYSSYELGKVISKQIHDSTIKPRQEKERCTRKTTKAVSITISVAVLISTYLLLLLPTAPYFFSALFLAGIIINTLYFMLMLVTIPTSSYSLHICTQKSNKINTVVLPIAVIASVASFYLGGASLVLTVSIITVLAASLLTMLFVAVGPLFVQQSDTLYAIEPIPQFNPANKDRFKPASNDNDLTTSNNDHKVNLQPEDNHMDFSLMN